LLFALFAGTRGPQLVCIQPVQLKVGDALHGLRRQGFEALPFRGLQIARSALCRFA
jgi:hypothetical protein